ncbi:MAG: threonylcarbamoyl-AMP synthase [Lachnospiraceae bacterium]|nr:threonylcarbamoyl-AMP synthase [Lachnospiraceae bacterium]
MADTINDSKKNTIVVEALSDYDDEVLQSPAKCLSKGGLVAFPTETVYGLGADGLNPEASKKIYAAKGRPSDNPLIVHIAEVDALEKLAYPNDMAYTLAQAFWPGPLTMVLPKKDIVPKETTGGLDTVAIRMPSHPAALSLIRHSGVYVAAPSANISGRPSPTKASHVIEDMDGRIDYIIDGGDVGIGIESTIVDLTSDIPTILRPGYITKKMLEDMVGEVIIDPALEKPLEMAAAGVHPKAPGMKYTHYAPKGELTLVEKGSINVMSENAGANENVVNKSSFEVVEKIKELAKSKQKEGFKVGIMAPEESFNEYVGFADTVICVGNRTKQATVAAGLYAALREFDDNDVEYIYAESFREGELSYAIMNRLLKAAGQRVIRV